MPPCLIIRKDGGTLYATRDITAALYRKKTYNFDTPSLRIIRQGGMFLSSKSTIIAPSLSFSSCFCFNSSLRLVPEFGSRTLRSCQSGQWQTFHAAWKRCLADVQRNFVRKRAEINLCIGCGQFFRTAQNAARTCMRILHIGTCFTVKVQHAFPGWALTLPNRCDTERGCCDEKVEIDL